MHTITLTSDEIDDLLYFTRANEADDLHQTITELTQKYGCEAREVLEAGIDPENGNKLLPSLMSQLKSSDVAANQVQLINRQNALGNTPLHWAAYNGHLAVVKLLLEAGAVMWVKNTAGHLAMFEAERADKSDVVQYLLEVGGRAVEQTGREGVASAEDEVDVQAGEDVNGNGAAKAEGQADGGVEVEMKDAGA
ncbi:ankyrin repeat-containing protein [Elasticomyces elasticus]|nr:ankyrin repeat-containing protein [Elasticomyces elasticus]KAK3646126.1 ankyrin repeat-containing protein [Elasticomyces elasticus]KAK4924307.1 ankyrin repeat-containing protein [Elasticomyces elasticus]KAK5759135.1 ankyrin repeat-containing protein [Elasticomyces elasticus]